MLHATFIAIVVLFGLAASSVVIEPINPVLRLGQVTKMRCQTPSSIKICLWEFNGDVHASGNETGNFENGECSYDLVLLQAHQAIQIKCQLFPMHHKGVPRVTTFTSGTTAVLPKIELEFEFEIVNNDTITAIAGKESMLTCTVSGARPKPDVLWKIGKPIFHKN